METVKDVIEQAYTKVNGEFEVIEETSSDFKTYLNVLNQIVRQWAHTPFVKWASLYDPTYTLSDEVESDKFVYALPTATVAEFGNTPYDSVYFVDEDGLTVEKYKMTDQPTYDSSQRTDICMIASNGLNIRSIPDELIGTSIRLPAYVFPSKYTSGSQLVKIDSIPWLVCKISAFICDSSPVPFIARNADKFHKEAEPYMKEMRENNRKRQHLIINSVSGAGNFDLGYDGKIEMVALANINNNSGSGVIDGGDA